MKLKQNFLTFIVALIMLTFVSGEENERIVGGFPVSIKHVPYQISLQTLKPDGRSRHFCGGSIISKKFIVTASHCVYDEIADEIVVLAGTSNHKKNGTKIKVEKIIMHENYNDKITDFDIAILKLENELKFSKSIQPIALPYLNESIPDDTMCIVSGWGDTDLLYRTKHLRAAKVPISNQKTCVKNYDSMGYKVTPRMICAGYKKGGRDSCQGDSGGPLACKIRRKKQPILVGIVSWGYLCAQPIFPGVYSRVSVLRQWIRDQTGV